MVDTLTTKERSLRMSRIKAANTGPEMTVRRMVHAMGFRYRLHLRSLPGTPDLVFPRLRKVVFVHGCFWHQHQKASCKLARTPKSRLDFWEPKLEANRVRDSKNRRLLKKNDWRVLEIWECELKNLRTVERRLRYFLEDEIS
jgi:DNA mismatch endonuclease (patch repair protein)